MLCYLLFILSNFFALYTSKTVVECIYKDVTPFKHLFTTLALLPVVIVLTILPLAIMGYLTPYTTTLLGGIFWVITMMVNHQFCHENRVVAHKPNRKWLRIFVIWAACIAIGVAIGFLFPGVKYGHDGLSFHSITPTLWLLHQKTMISPYSMFAYYPFNSEMISLWLMLPFHNDAMVGMVFCFWLGLFLMVIKKISDLYQINIINLLFLFLVFLLSPVVQNGLRGFASTNMVPVIMLLVAIVFLVETSYAISKNQFYILIVLSGLFSGFAVGVKTNFLPQCFILFIWVLYHGYNKDKEKKYRMNAGLLFVGSALLAGGYWYIRNICLTGNPCYPMSIPFFEGPFSREQMRYTSLISWIAKSPTDMTQWKYILERLLHWPFPLWCLSLFGYIAFVYRRCISNKVYENRCVILKMEWLLFITAMVMMLLYPFQPLSAASAAGMDAPMHIKPRYLLYPFVVGVILYFPLLKSDAKYCRLFQGVVLVMLLLRSSFSVNELAIVSVLVTAFCLQWFFSGKIKRQLNLNNRLHCFPYHYLVLILIGFTCCYPQQKTYTDNHLFKKKYKNISTGTTWKALESLPVNAKIDWFGYGQGYLAYPYFGRELQFYPTRASSLMRPHHEKWLKQKGHAQADATLNITKEEKVCLNIDTIIKKEIDYVVVLKKDDNSWPLMQQMLLEKTAFKKYFETESSVIWQVVGGTVKE